tara:strand:- start:31608 stop:31802 length:195 start_codon:yes stop_codon:yes gene_type:complete
MAKRIIGVTTAALGWPAMARYAVFKRARFGFATPVFRLSSPILLARLFAEHFPLPRFIDNYYIA